MPHRLLRGLAAAALILLGAIVPAGAATASTHPGFDPGTVDAWAAPDSPTGTQDFTFDSFDGVYELSRDGSNRSLLRVTETLVAVFPDFDQNHGILRAIPTTYDGHPTQIHVDSTTDENGQSYPLSTSFENGNIIMQVGDPDVYLTGTHTFVITYTMKDVTRYFADTGDDEFYWDTNGLLWGQPFGSVTAHVVLGDGLASALNGNAACYYGSSGSTTQCELAQTATGFDASVTGLGAYQNMTVSIGFAKGTFLPAPFDLLAYVPLPVLLGFVGSIGGAILAVVLRFTVLRGTRGTGIVVAQYEPDDAISPLLAANLVGKTKKGMAAAIVDLAVRGKIRIIEKPAEGFFASGTTFGVQRAGDDSDVDADDERVLSALFATSGLGFLSRLLRSGGATAPGLITLGQQIATLAGDDAASASGEVRWLVKKDQILGQQVVSITKAVATEAQTLKLRTKPPALPIAIVAILVVVGFILLLLGGINATTDLGIMLGVFGTIVAAWLGVGALIMLGGQRPLTKAGALAVEHLEGLKEYIRLAEADRLQMLQSVTGAERTPLDKTAAGGPDIVKIYEKLLPYAVIFGLEKEWAGELAKYYDETPPDWYQGSNMN
ncbi:MAG: DUF2207 domain-containing protein, partial [Pseudolysinimonas sp.]